jgi:putative membrane protein
MKVAIVTVVTLAAALVCVHPAVFAQSEAASTTAANPLSAVDRGFVQAASMASSTEIDASKLALQNTSNPDVHAFARHMIADHTKLTIALKLAAPHGVAVPVDNSDTGLLDTLRPLKGKAFDDAYAQKVGLAGHQQAVRDFQKEITDGDDDSLKQAAQKGLPTIEEHYRMAQQLAGKLGIAQQ